MFVPPPGAVRRGQRPGLPGGSPVMGLNSATQADATGYWRAAGTAALRVWKKGAHLAELLPASVTEVTVAPSWPWPGNPAPVTVTSAAAVRRLAALVNGLPLSAAGPGVPCSLAAGFTLTFRAAAGGPPAAVADGPAACGQVSFRLDGKDLPALLPADAGAYRDAVLKTAGPHWKLG